MIAWWVLESTAAGVPTTSAAARSPFAPGASVSLPFSEREFLDVFGAYNTLLWPVVLSSWGLAVAVFIGIARRKLGTTSRGKIAAAFLLSRRSCIRVMAERRRIPVRSSLRGAVSNRALDDRSSARCHACRSAVALRRARPLDDCRRERGLSVWDDTESHVVWCRLCPGSRRFDRDAPRRPDRTGGMTTQLDSSSRS